MTRTGKTMRITMTKRRSQQSSENRTNVNGERGGVWLLEITHYL
jgi:hypothetical protein